MLSLNPQLSVVLVIENDEATLLRHEKFLQGSSFQLLPACTVRQARDLLRAIQPQAVILDILLPGEDSWPLLAEMNYPTASYGVSGRSQQE